MKTIIKVLATILFVSFTFLSFGQTGLSFFNKQAPANGFTKSGKSKVIIMKKGATKEIKIRLHKGKSYYIMVASQKRNNNIQYRITDTETGNIIYDNSVFEFNTSNTLYSNADKYVTVEITTQPDVFLRKNAKREKVNFVLAYKKDQNHEKNININNNTAVYVYN